MVICESCGKEMSTWKLDEKNQLSLCKFCKHVQRSLKEAPADCREHAWGGVGLFDHIRTWFTWRSQQKYLKKKKQPSDNVLELGFGAGLMLKRHIALGHKCTGVEADLLEIGLPEYLKGKINFHASSAENMNLPPNIFNLVYAIHVAEHLLEPQKVFGLIYNTLVPGGVLQFLTPNGSSAGLSIFRSHWWNLEDPTHIRFYSPESIKYMLEKAGFTDVEVRFPRWDSLTLEGASFARCFLHHSGKHGVMSKKTGKLLALFSAPFFAFVRLFWGRLNPSMEIYARKPTA